MGIGPLGENLIFIISQLRTGSTLLQRMLGSHPNIHTASEPWLMLHPIYALRTEGYEAEYDSQRAREALTDFLGTFPNGEDAYTEGIRRMCIYLYESALLSSGKRYFLDKTPRYYLIIPELSRTFPDAKYIILLRNPLAVLSSILSTWVMEQLSLLYNYRNDLLRAPRLILEGAQLLGDRGLVVQYEALVTNPERETRRICDMLGEDWKPEILDYNGNNLPHWQFGDQKDLYKHSGPVTENTQKWIETIRDPQIWRIANEYLQSLGPEIVEQMGYPYAELQGVLEANRPRKAQLWPTFSLTQFMKEPSENRRKWQRAVARAVHLLDKRGTAIDKGGQLSPHA